MPPLSEIFGILPKTLCRELVEEYSKLSRNYNESRWESAELDGGRFCEIVYTIVSSYPSSKYPGSASKPKDMAAACRELERLPNDIPRTVKILIPRVLLPMYEIRNNRNVGHVGGDVNPNKIDSDYVFSSAKWIMGELIRIYHSVSLEQAQRIVDMLAERHIPIIWEVGEEKRILKAINKEDQTLLLLHQSNEANANDLARWVEYSNPSVYKKKILIRGHKLRLWEYNQTTGLVSISPIGVQKAEYILSKYTWQEGPK